MPSTGLFTFQASYGLSNCTDGSSNTIAFAEAAVGSQTAQLGQKLVGVVNVAAIQPYETLDASTNYANMRAALQACQAAWSSGTGGNADDQCGENWWHGAMSQGLGVRPVASGGQPHRRIANSLAHGFWVDRVGVTGWPRLLANRNPFDPLGTRSSPPICGQD
jgi:hypothetical protein